MMSLVVAPDANHIAFLYKFTGPATAAAAIQDSMGRRPPVELGSVTFSVQALAFMPDGQSVAALMEDNRIVVFSSATGRPQRSFQIAGQSAKDRLIALSPTGRWLAVSSASNCGVDIYEFDTGELRYGLPDREGTTYWLAWHPGEQRLAIARDNGDIASWDLAIIDAQLEELGLGLGSDRAAASAAKGAP